MNPLQQFPTIRQWAYRLVWSVGLFFGGMQAYLAAVDRPTPQWVFGALAVLAYVSVATNYTADMNVGTKTEPPVPYEPRHHGTGGAS